MFTLLDANSKPGRAKARTPRGFTLLELMVVVSILAFLIGLLLPALKRSMRLAAATVCKYNMREVGTGLQMYGIENQGWLPTAPTVLNTHRSSSENEPWFAKLHPSYLPEPEVFSCPDDPFRFQFSQYRSRLRLPIVAELSSYGINSFITNGLGGNLSNLDRYTPTRPLDTILVADIGPEEHIRRPRSSGQDSFGAYRNASRLSWDDGLDPFVRRTTPTWLTARHGDGINVLTIGHAVREAKTVDVLKSRIRSDYPSCAAGGCTLCNDLKNPHYSFARSRLYWWTGPAPVE